MASTPILVPIIYILLLVGALYTFSSVYRKRNAARISKMETWFPTHPERDTYISLLQLQPSPSDVLLKAALLKRAVADVHRILAFREDKAALQQLLQKGSISDDLWNSFLAAEKELEAEIVEVVGEANTFHPGWGQFIFQSASEMVNNAKHRDIFATVVKLKSESEAKAIGSIPAKSSLPKSNLLAPTTPQSSVPTTPQKKTSVLPKAPTTPSTPTINMPNIDNAAEGSSSATPSVLSPKTPGSASKKGKKRK